MNPTETQQAQDERFMKEALRQAKKAASIGEVPVGCVIVRDGVIVSRGYNRREIDGNALAHAEIRAIDRACKRLGGWRLWQCDLYVTLEPCLMCSGAIVNARLRRVVYGASDNKNGALSGLTLAGQYQPEIVSGICQEPCTAVLKDFFAAMRARRAAESEQRAPLFPAAAEVPVQRDEP